jgi:hypothetical protein
MKEAVSEDGGDRDMFLVEKIFLLVHRLGFCVKSLEITERVDGIRIDHKIQIEPIIPAEWKT